MNAHSHPDPRLAEKLTALSLAPAPAGSRPPKRLGGRTLLFIAAATIATAGVAAVPVLDDGDAAKLLSRLLPSLAGASSGASGVLPGAAAEKIAEVSPPPVPPAPVVTGSGHVVALEDAAVHPRRGGTIVEILADVGGRVEAGEVLLRLDDPEARFALRAARLARDRARLVLAARELDQEEAEVAARRMGALAAGGAVNAQKALDADNAERRAANLAGQGAEELAQAELAVERAGQAVAELAVTTPIAGVVTARGARFGEAILAQVDARGDAALFTITNPGRLAIDVDIAETAVAAVRPGIRGEAVLDGYPDRPFAVEVTRIAPVASAERGTVSLRLSVLSPPAGIRPAMAVRVALARDGAVASISQGH